MDVYLLQAICYLEAFHLNARSNILLSPCVLHVPRLIFFDLVTKTISRENLKIMTLRLSLKFAINLSKHHCQRILESSNCSVLRI